MSYMDILGIKSDFIVICWLFPPNYIFFYYNLTRFCVYNNNDTKYHTWTVLDLYIYLFKLSK